MDSVKSLSDFERKLITIIQHYNREKRSPGLHTLVNKTGRHEDDIIATIQDLVARRWIVVHDKKIRVRQKLF